MYNKNEIQHRLSLLELAQTLGNISEACRPAGHFQNPVLRI